MKHTLAVILLGGVLLLNGAGNWLFAQTERDGVTTVYFTQDLSEKGLKKSIKKHWEPVLEKPAIKNMWQMIIC